jgi:hypothetical protein
MSSFLNTLIHFLSTAMRKILLFIFIFCLLKTHLSFAYVMSSDNYRIQLDSINIGGVRQTSVSYNMEDTIGEIATGISTSTSYKLKAGYQQMQEVYISISAPEDVDMGSIGGLSGGTATGSITWNIKTDSSSGYNLTIKSSASPALNASTSSFADYTPVSPSVPDYDWDIDSANSEFGFAPYNSNSQIQKYKNNGSNCNVGSNITDGKCWYSFSTASETVVNKLSRTNAFGENTKINLRAEINTTPGYQEEGNYYATIVATALPN